MRISGIGTTLLGVSSLDAEAIATATEWFTFIYLPIRYHPQSQTSSNIVHSIRVLAGTLDHEAIVTAAAANRTSDPPPLTELLDALVRYAVVCSTCIQRKQIWSAVEILHRMRTALMQLYVRTHGGHRAYQYFDVNAPHTLQAQLEVTLSSSDIAS